MTYVPSEYWAKRGQTYEAEAHERGWWDAEDPPLLELIGNLKPKSILEIGCGYGRVGAAILKRWPEMAYTGIDISADLIEASRRRLPNAELIVADAVTFEDDRQWDLVLAANTLGHIRPEDLPSVWAKMLNWARRDIIHIDWNEVGAKTAYQFGHDYRALHGRSAMIPMGATTLHHVPRP